MARIKIHNTKTGKVVDVEAAAFTPHLQKQGWELVQPLKFQTQVVEVLEKKSVVEKSEEEVEPKKRGRKPKQ